LQDVVALANTNGGTIYIGASPNIRLPVSGVPKPFETITQLRGEFNRHIVPPIEVQMDTLKSGGKQILQLIVPRGTEVPYALDSTQIYVRSENETSLAVRDEIVNLVKDALAIEFSARVENAPLKTVQAVEQAQEMVQAQEESEAQPAATATSGEPGKLPSPPPHTGVEIVASKARPRGNNQYTMRDLRNNRIIHNVTRSSARKLWQYAIAEHDKNVGSNADVKWLGDIGIVKASERAGKLRYDLAQRDSNGDVYVYYGVTDDGIHGAWKDLIESLSGQTTVEQLADDDENGIAVVPEEYVTPADVSTIEPTEAQDAALMFEADDAAIPQADAEDDGTLGIESATPPAEPPKLMTSPGRNHFPPMVSDLSPSTQETDDVPASAGLGVIPGDGTLGAQVTASNDVASESGETPTTGTAASDGEHDEMPTMATAQMPAEQAEPAMTAHDAATGENETAPTAAAETPASGELGVVQTESAPVAIANEHDQAPMMASEAVPASGAMGSPDPGSTPSEWAHEHINPPVTPPASQPDPIVISTARTEFAKAIPMQVESGGEFAPIVEVSPTTPHDGKPESAPNVRLNYDDQIVLPPTFGK
jgi:Schlafen, AlbA_2